MNSFAFIIHPILPREDVKKKFKLLGTFLPEKWIHFLSGYFPPVLLSEVKGIRSEATGREVRGWLLACPLTAKRMLEVPTEFAYRKIVQTGRLAEKLGADIIGLGAFTSVVGDAGITVAERLSTPVTTGNSYTVAAALEIAEILARERLGKFEDATVAVVGATGSIGWALSRILSRKVKRLILVARHIEKLGSRRKQLGSAEVKVTRRMDALREADVIFVAAGAVMPLVKSRHLKEGAIVCDISIPSNVAAEVLTEREDVHVVKGGVVRVPGDAVDFGFDFGLDPGLAYACMAETIALALEGRFESYTLGRDLDIEKVLEIQRIARKHGFKPVAFTPRIIGGRVF